MFFGNLPTDQTAGCYLAHSLSLADGRVRKGVLITDELITRLLRCNVEQLTVARLDAGDVHEDEAAGLLAQSICGENLTAGLARTGRVNLYASEQGLLGISTQAILGCNAISDSITVATLPANQWVEQGRLVATVKIIPYAVPGQALQAAINATGTTDFIEEAKRVETTYAATSGGQSGHHAKALSLHKPCQQRAHMIQTRLPGTAEKLLQKTVVTTRNRLTPRQVTLASETICSHDVQSLRHSIVTLIRSTQWQNGDWLLLVGASAISDPADVIPAALLEAIEVNQAKGSIQRLGIPVDPGNLLMLGMLDDHPVIGMPGCARSPKYNGFDQFIDRLACKLPITNDWINSLSVGGLMGEILERPHPRINNDRGATRLNTAQANEPCRDATDEGTGTDVATTAVVLAAGSSRRFGSANKLLANWRGRPLLIATIDNLLCSNISDVLLISGPETDRIHQVLGEFFTRQAESSATSGISQASHHSVNYHSEQHDKIIRCLHNPLHDTGMASSIRLSISSLLLQTVTSTVRRVPSALICLADMPQIHASTLNQLIKLASAANVDTAALGSDRVKPAVYVPTCQGRRGNPVLMQPSMFDALLTISGDRGAKALLRQHEAAVHEVHVNDEGVLLDIDTPEQLEQLEQKQT